MAWVQNRKAGAGAVQGQGQGHGAHDSRARAENGSKDGTVKDRIARRRRN